MKNIQNLTIDINKKPFQTITANTGEVGSRFIKITILDNSTPVDLTGITVYIYAKKPDGTKLFNTVKIEDAANGIILAELTSQVLAVEGIVKLNLLLTENGKKLKSKQFLLNVDRSILDEDAIESSNEFGALTRALDKVDEWNGYFDETSGKIEEKYTERLNKVDSQLEQNKKEINDHITNHSVGSSGGVGIPQGFKVFAHRGGDGFAPENTVYAYENAYKLGVKWIECDVRETLDGEFILVHNNSVDAYTENTGLIKEMTLTDLKAMNITKGTDISYYPNTKFCTLDEFLNICFKYNLNPIMEIKEFISAGAYDLFVKKLKKYSVDKKCIVSSFSTSVLSKINEIDANISLDWLSVDIDSSKVSTALLSNFSSLSIPISAVTKEKVELAHNNNLNVYIYTVETYENYKNLLECNIDGIYTGILFEEV